MGTLPEWWTAPYPEVTSAETATSYIDALGGSLSRRQENGNWVLSTGDQELVRVGTPEELEAFVLGFALAHVICERHGPIGRRQVVEVAPAGAVVAEVVAVAEAVAVPADDAGTGQADASGIDDDDATTEGSGAADEDTGGDIEADTGEDTGEGTADVRPFKDRRRRFR